MTASVFFIGGVLYSVLKRLKWLHYLIFISIFILGVYNGYDHFYLNTNFCPDLIISFLWRFLVAFIAQISEVWRKISILSFVGEHSLLVLCVHLVAIETMGQYFNYFINFIGITGDVPLLWGSLVLNIVFSITGTFVILFLSPNKKKFLIQHFYRNVSISAKRDYSADVMKGIFIISMLVGHSVIDVSLRRIIYSCHMVAFIFCLDTFIIRLKI